jgi:hypothetical protein
MSRSSKNKKNNQAIRNAKNEVDNKAHLANQEEYELALQIKQSGKMPSPQEIQLLIKHNLI